VHYRLTVGPTKPSRVWVIETGLNPVHQFQWKNELTLMHRLNPRQINGRIYELRLNLASPLVEMLPWIAIERESLQHV
jgi:hypothetical protein